MADFLLSVGVDVELSYEQMQRDIASIVTKLNNNKPKITFGLDLDTSKIEDIRTQLGNINLNVGTSKSSSSALDADSIHRIAEATKVANTRFLLMNKRISAITTSFSEMKKATGTSEMINQLSNVEAVLKEIETHNTSISSTYKNLNKILGDSLATGQNASDVEAIKQKYIEYNAAVERLRMTKATASKEDIESIYRLQAELQGLMASIQERILLEAEAAAAAAAASAASEGASEAAQSAENEKNQALIRALTLLKQLRDAEEKWTAARNGKSSTAYTGIQSERQALEKLLIDYQAGNITLDQFKSSVLELNAAFKINADTIRQNGENTKTWAERIGALSAKFGTWFSITNIIMAAYRAIRQMVTSVIELDTAMTELKKVTDETDATYERFLVNATKRAKELGASLSDTVSATADFARLGYGIADAEKLADAAIVYKNVGDGIDDIGTASESIIATMQAFGIAADDVMSIVDKFNEVGNKYAISSVGVGDALLRSAAAMHAANNSLDETIALATAANTIVQDPDKVGNVLKTVSMYLRAAKTEADEAGESTEGMANSVSDLREEILSLTGGAVDIQIDEDTFKSTYQILKELSVVWERLTDISRANILEMVGGKRNSNVVAALLENFSVAENALKTSAESAGSALEENAKQLESIQGKINVMKASFEALAQNIIGGDVVKLVVEFATVLLNITNGITSFINACGGLPTVLLSVASALLILKSELIMTNAQLIITAGIKGVVALFTSLKSGIMSIIPTIQTAIAAWKSYAAGAAGAATANAALQATIPVIGWVLAAISAVVAATSLFSDENSKAKKSIQELNSEYNSLKDEISGVADAYRELKSTSDNVIPRFAELAKGVDKFGKNVSLTDEEYAEFLELNNKIADMFPEINMGMDSSGNAMLALSYSADTLTNSLNALVEAQRNAANQQIAETMPDVLDNITNSNEVYKNKIDELKDIQEEYRDVYNDFINRSLPTSVGRYSTLDAGEAAARDFIAKAQELGIHGSVMVDNQQSTNNGYVFTVDWDYSPLENNSKFLLDYVDDQFAIVTQKYDKLINDYQSKIAAKWAQLNPVVNSWMQTDFMFQDLNDAMQEIAEVMVSGLDFGSLGLTDETAIQKYIDDNIVEPLFLAAPEVKDAFANITDWQKEFKNGEITSEEFANKIMQAFDSMFASMSPDVIDEFKTHFVDGFNQIGISGDSFIAVLQNLIAEWSRVEQTVQSAKSPQDTINKFRGIIDVLRAASDEYRNTGYVSTDTYNDVIDLSKDYADIFDFSTGKIEINNDALQKHIDSLVKEYGATLASNGASETQIRTLATLASAFSQTTQEVEVTTSTLKNLVDVYGDAAEGTELSTLETLDLIEQYPELIGAIEQTANGYKIEESAVRDLIVEKANLLKINESLAKQAARQTLVDNSKNSATADTVDKIFEDYYKNTGKQIESFDDYVTAWESYFSRKSSGNWVEGLEEYVEASITEAERLTMIDKLLDDLKSGNIDRWHWESSYDSNRTERVETEFEKAYKKHQHLLAMDKESVSSYLTWLTSAYKAAYTAGQIDLDEYYKYQEEVYEKTKEMFDDVLNDSEHQISILSRHDGNTGEIVRMYQEMQAAVHAQAEKYRAAGLDDNHELIQELQTLWWEYYDAIVDKTVESYEELASHSKNQISFTETLLDNAVAAGDYDAVRQHSDTIIAEYKKMQSILHDEAEYYRSLGYADTSNEVSELMTLWWEYYDAIVEAASSGFQELVDNANASLDEIQNVYTTLTEAAQEQADSGFITVDTMQNILSLGANYLAMLQDENGQLVINEENIRKVIAARTQQVAIETSLNFVQQLRTALNNEDVASLNNLLYATDAATNSTWGLVYAQLAALELTDDQYSTALQRVNAIRSLADNAVTSIGQTTGQVAAATEAAAKAAQEQLEQTSDALKDILDYTIEMIKQEVNNQVDALKDQVKQYRKIVDLQKESLDLAREKDNYERSVADKVKEIAKIEARIQQLSLDDSREAQAEKAKLQEELAKLQQDLADTQADHAYEVTVDSLDKMADAYEDEKNEEVKILEDSISSYEKLYQLAIARIDSQWDTLYQDLINWNTQYGNDTNETITNAWNNASIAVQQYGGYLNAVKATQDAMNAANSQTNVTTTTPTGLGASGDYSTSSRVSTLVRKMKANSASWFDASDEERKRLSDENYRLAAEVEALIGQRLVRGDDGVWYIGSVGSNDRLYEKYHQGGIVGDSTLKKDEVMAILKDGELVLDEKREQGLYRLVDFAQVLSERLGTAINASSLENMFKGLSLIPTTRDLLPATRSGYSSLEFSPKIEVNISHGGEMSDVDARRYGNIAAETALSELKDAFTKRGITNIGSSILK